MPVTMKDFGIEILSVDDRLALVQEIWDSISSDPDFPAVTESQKRLFDKRMAELDANPHDVLSWEEIKRHVKRKP